MVIMNEIGGLERQRVYVSAMRTEVKPCNKNHYIIYHQFDHKGTHKI